ncbi:MAG: hypothetical protein BGO21_01525 [Dyadobacter sp. 50-39]|uniref:hypothetical protein n=1 Tax=Dyadobacter sp. 50-39 TaxID=1895756 RepID=UPI00095999E9|nr:hypothetical protein [Dyadobacter sp. 50-39]OJV18931.1 MAG: hypothetical protein BGO21_01525 [Dyadobacter sp. 50-39]
MDFCNAIDDSKYNGKIGAAERRIAGNINDLAGMAKFNSIFKKIDRQKYPFVDGLYYLFIIVFLLILFLFFG